MYKKKEKKKDKWNALRRVRFLCWLCLVNASGWREKHASEQNCLSKVQVRFVICYFSCRNVIPFCAEQLLFRSWSPQELASATHREEYKLRFARSPSFYRFIIPLHTATFSLCLARPRRAKNQYCVRFFAPFSLFPSLPRSVGNISSATDKLRGSPIKISANTERALVGAWIVYSGN